MPDKTLRSRRPDVADMWDYDLNGDETPDTVSYGTDRKFYWRCPEGPDHSWWASPNSMTGPKKWGTGCPFCAGRELSVTNRLDLNHPEIAAQWFQERNEDVTPDKVLEGSLDEFWWKCDNGPDHEWKQRVRVRTKQGTGCRFCAGHEVSVTNSLAALYPDAAKLWAYDLNYGLTPDDIVAKTNRKYMWRCPKGPDHVWSAMPNSVTRPKKRGTGCPFCAGRRLSVTNSLVTLRPEVAEQFDSEHNPGIDVNSLRVGMHKRIWWRCPKGPDHLWRTTVTHRVGSDNKKGSGCPCCAGQKISITNSLATRFPDLALEWSWELNAPLTPDDVTHGSNIERWWICDNGPDHEWKAAPSTRRFRGCPFCAGKKVSVTNSLAMRFPKIAAEWDYGRNGKLTPDAVTSGANRSVFWICREKGHRFKTHINWRTSDGSGCPECHVRPASHIEVALKFELSEFFKVDLKPGSKVKGVDEKSLSVDIVLPDDRIIIEYDGYYYHKTVADRYESDSRKTDSIKRAGWTVVRIREEGLQMIGFDDIQVPVVDEGPNKTEQKKEVVNLLLKHIEGIVCRPIPRLDEYISQPRLRRYDDALDFWDNIKRSSD